MPISDYDRVVLQNHSVVEMLTQKDHQNILLGIRDTTVSRTLNVAMTIPEIEQLIKKLQRQVELLKNNK